MRFDWMLMAGPTVVPIAKGDRCCSSPARLARWVRRHDPTARVRTKGLSLWYRPIDWRGRPLRQWQMRPIAARVA